MFININKLLYFISFIIYFQKKKKRMSAEQQPAKAVDAVFVESVKLPEDTPICKGYDFDNGINYEELFKSYITMGFQATNIGRAIEQINMMVSIVKDII